LNKEKLRFPFYILFHPFDGFYELRHREKGSLIVAVLLVFLFGLSFTLNRKYAGFVVNELNPLYVDSLTDVLGVGIAVLLFSVANWSVTCLMNGEGRFKDIFMVISYSMLPMVLTFIPATILSWFIAADEESIYYLIKAVAIVFFIALLLIGIMTVHGYSFGKTLLTMLLTFIAAILIIFIALLLAYLVTQIISFFRSIYTELIIRV
jgi:hypothetical protein